MAEPPPFCALGGLALPPGLHCADEFAWSPVLQTTATTLSGAAVVEEWPRAAGRTITLEGGRRNGQTWTWLTRGEFIALEAAGQAAGVVWTLSLPDARSFRVTPRRDGPGGAWIEGYPMPAFSDVPPPNPDDGWRYVVERIRLMEIPA